MSLIRVREALEQAGCRAALRGKLPQVACTAPDLPKYGYPLNLLGLFGGADKYIVLGIVTELLLRCDRVDRQALTDIVLRVTGKAIPPHLNLGAYLERVSTTRKKILEVACGPLEYDSVVKGRGIEGHPDARTPDAIFEVKTSGRVRESWRAFLLQVFAYAALDAKVKKVYLVLPLQESVWMWDVAAHWPAREKFREALEAFVAKGETHRSRGESATDGHARRKQYPVSAEQRASPGVTNPKTRYAPGVHSDFGARALQATARTQTPRPESQKATAASSSTASAAPKPTEAQSTEAQPTEAQPTEAQPTEAQQTAAETKTTESRGPTPATAGSSREVPGRLARLVENEVAVAAPPPVARISEERHPAKIRVGCHVSVRGGIAKSLSALSDARASYQIFLCAPTTTKTRVSEAETAATKKIIAERGLSVFAHAPYLVNLSSASAYNVSCITEQLSLGCSVGLKGVVVHVGKACKNTAQSALQVMRESLEEAASAATLECPLLLETPAGQGTELLWENPEVFFSFLAQFGGRVGACIDTCHVFACGFNPSEYLLIAAAHPEWQKLIKLIHFNDSEKPKGSRVDRHAPVGTGFIGVDELQRTAEMAVGMGVPLLCE